MNIKEFTKLAKERGYQKVYLNCYIRNSEALKFYKSRGYTKIDVCLEKTI